MSSAISNWTRLARALVVAAGLVGTQSAQAQAPKVEAPAPLSIILATPAFYSLPVSILLKNGAEFGVKLELFELHGGGEAGAVFAGGNGDILAAGIDKLFGLRRGGIADVLAFGVILTSANWSLVAFADEHGPDGHILLYRQAPREAAQQFFRRQQSHACCREFDSERQSIQAQADLGD